MKYTIPKDEVAVLAEFLAESEDHLEGIEDKVLKLEVSKDIDLVNTIFRPIHTIKGSSSFLGLENIAQLSHEVETLLDDIRKERITEIDSEIIDLLLEAFDATSKMLTNTSAAVETAGAGNSTDETFETDIADVPYEEIMARVIDIREKKTGRTSTSPSQLQGEPGDADSALNAPLDYGKIKYPGEMKMQYEIEGSEHLVKIEDILLTLEKAPKKLDLFNDLFRALHSLKGNTGVILSVIENENIRRRHFLNNFKEIAHLAESIVQKKRDHKRILKGEEIEILLKSTDCLKGLMDCFKNNQPAPKQECPEIPQLRQLVDTVEADLFDRQGNIKEIGGDSLAEAVSNSLSQSLEAIRGGLDQLADEQKRPNALKKLKRSYKNLVKIGTRINHKLVIEKSSAGLNLVEFMTGAPGPDPNEELFIQNLGDDLELLSEKGDRRKNRELEDRRKATIPPPTTEYAKDAEARIGEKVLKVSQEKIDVFMNLIGELLVSKNSLNAFEREVSEKYDLPEIAKRLKEAADTIASISNDLQANIMDIRMLPVANAFSKFPRMIRDLSRKLNKKIRLEISGEETEIDKNIIEALADPLVHMIRNSADHGIESPEERVSTGKPEEGTVQLAAFNQGQHVVIRISDDGKGMNPEKIKTKALERALVPPEELQEMDDHQVLNLIFLPGFSLAGAVSDVSGRGVGMDVVKTNIERLGGETIVESIPGKGSTFTVKLPLTMAIGRGLEVEAQNNRYYVPLEAIRETLRVPAENLFQYKGREMTVIRGQLIPVYRLATQLGLENGDSRSRASTIKEALVILSIKGQKVGLLVDNYYNETEYVIKPLSSSIAAIDGISGAMITGEGKVYLILDLLRLF